MTPTHKCLVIKPRATDYVKGVNSPIEFKAVTDGDWTSHLFFQELQEINGWDTDGCVLFTAQESFDAQMDALWPTLPATVQAQIASLGYLDTGTDGLQHFHSSARFLQVLTGNAYNGNSLPDPWDVMRTYGVLPWRDLSFDATVTEAEYLTPIPQASLDKAAQFLALLGGKTAIQYHWINDGGPSDTTSMDAARPQAPLCIGIAVNDAEWNMVQPAIASGAPAHSVQNYASETVGEKILDHYVPFDKVLIPGYPIQFVLQGIVTYIVPIEQEIVSDTATVVSDVAADPTPTPAQKAGFLEEIEQVVEAMESIL